MTSTFSGRPADRVARTVGGYRLLERIGEGGMGVVHLAEDRHGQRAALKVLRPNVVGDDESRRRLAQEVDSLQHVRSDHVAEIVDADPWGEVPYVVTRYVPGESLHARVEESGPLPPDELEEVARGLLLAVHDVHGVGVLHRDIKPTNVVMDGTDPVLIDFGLARLAEDPRLTATGWLMGTPGYLAPEVLLGGMATTATDVHGWAATVVYAATGRSPYGSGHVMTMLDRTRQGAVDLTGVPAPLCGLLAAALAVEPHQRPRVGEALARLESLGSDAVAPPHTRPYTVVRRSEPPPGPRLHPAPWQDRLTGWARMRRLFLLLVLVGVVAACAGTAPYVTAGLVGAVLLLVRGMSHSAQATWARRSVRGRRWFDAPLAVTTYPWHLVRGSLGALALLAFGGLVGAAVTAGLVLGGWPATQALPAGGATLAVAVWAGPGSGRVREPLGRAASSAARHASVWWLVTAALAVLGGAWWWAGQQQGVLWEPAPGPPWHLLRDLAASVGLPNDGMRTP